MELKYSVAPKNDRCFANDFGLPQVQIFALNETSGEKFAEIFLENEKFSPNFAGPIANSVADPGADPGAGSAANSAAGSAAGPIAGPAAGSTADPAAGSAAKSIDGYISVLEPDPDAIRKNSAFALQVQIRLRDNGTALPASLIQIRYKKFI